MKSKNIPLNIGTLVNHYTEGEHAQHAHVAPIYQTSTFSFEDVQAGADIFTGKSDAYTYTRLGNPNARQLAQKLAALEGLDLLAQNPGVDPVKLVGGRVFSSGMAAISAVLLSLAKAGETIIAQKVLYGTTYTFLKNIAPDYIINVFWVDGEDLDAWKEAFARFPGAPAYLESPANPTLDIVDIAAIAHLAEKAGSLVVIDNTFATPYCQRPLSLGADIVVHSTTKYLGGLGTIVGGAVISRHPDFFDSSKSCFPKLANSFGGTPSPFDTWLTNLGLKTFELRMQRHTENAFTAARWLEAHPRVSKVYYPGLESFSGHATAKKQMFNGFGGMLSFDLAGGYKSGVKLMEAVQLITLAVSLGNVDSLIQHPASMTHAGVPPEVRLQSNITDSLVRFSVGIENWEDIQADLAHALEKV
ncbi:MAG: aminotransferase class I/II-fold pyridoxal phosphate-dependent enzyme [Anaerolineales bacterium]|nr:aminotransferase class I/II-fold pyridoxal phosphate-dependent enzyme [Anaerolineales bacterium]